MSIAEDFKTFCDNLIVPNIGTISARYKAITKRLNKDFRNTESETAHSFYTGSYGRNTAIKGISDLDMLYVLPYEIYKNYDSYLGFW
jgi:tRNA nucleotidyltransferase (CCA-adding enzyme)